MQYPAHGANAASLYKALQIPMPEQVVDVSENVNVFGMPSTVKEQWPQLIEQVSSYPHEQAEPFRSEVAKHHGVGVSQIAVSNGGAEALMALAQFFQKQRIVLLEPSFSEYRRTLQQQQCRIHSLVVDDIIHYSIAQEKVQQALAQAEVLYICNPNNPTGVLLKRAWIEEILQACPHIYLVVDEAFMDWTDESESMVPLVNRYPRLIVVRSMTKMYAMAGVRLGYVVSQQAETIARFFPHWNVSSIASSIGSICLQEHEFVERSRRHSAQLREQMTRDLQNLGCRVTKSAANFLTFQLDDQLDPDPFFQHLLTEGVVLRHTKNYEGLHGKWFRIAVKDTKTWRFCLERIAHYVYHY